MRITKIVYIINSNYGKLIMKLQNDLGNKQWNQDFRRITKVVRPMIFDNVKFMFSQFEEQIITNSIEYIIFAIWGPMPENRLDKCQQFMYMNAQALVMKAVDALEIDNLDGAQGFYLAFLIREIIVHKIITLRAIAMEKISFENSLLLIAAEPAGYS
jgi:hypothetical protein